MLSRRALASSAAAAILAPALARAKGFEPRGYDGRLERFFALDLESRDAFMMAHRTWVKGGLMKEAYARANAIFKENGINPAEEIGLPKIIALLENDPVMAQHAWHYVRGQQLQFSHYVQAFESRADELLSEMEKEDKVGPGKLELNPKMFIPAYAKEEIHNQPGGYVGNPFAGHIYYYGTNNFWIGANHQDEMDAKMAAVTPVPKDGKVKRILDMGTGDGRYAMALKERFPDAEVWGIDVGGPMVRFAHMRANDMNNGTNFAQRLAEDTKFPDGHFDIVTSFLLFHEVNADANKKIMDEMGRVTRPGGVVHSPDIPFRRRSQAGPQGFQLWWNTRWNYEVWMIEHVNTDYATEFPKRGFSLGPISPGGSTVLTKV